MLRLITLVCAAMVALAAPAEAQKPSKEQIAKAQHHFERATRYQELGEYQKAAEEYLEAYALYPEPEFFFNVGEAYRLAGDKDKAIEYFEKYLELDPGGRGSIAARKSVGELRDELEQEKAARRAAEEEAARRAAKEKETEPAPHVEPVPRDRAERATSRPGGGLRLAGIASLGAGALLVGTGAYFGLEARSISDELSEADRFDQSLYDDGKSAERTMFIMYGLGAAAVTTGAVLYYLGHRAGREGRAGGVVLAPAVHADGVSVRVLGTF
jgi:tetratricopeptide (TPR) repeat protein